MTFKTAALVCPAFLCVLLAIFIYFKGQNSRMNRIFILNVLNVSCWSLALAFFYTVKEPLAITFWAKVVYINASLIPPLFVLFSYVFPDGKLKLQNYQRALLFLPAVIIAFLYMTTPLIIKSAFEKNGIRGFEYGPLRLLWDIEYKAIFAFGFYRFLGLYKTARGVTREKIRYIIIANLYLCLLGGIPHVLLPFFKIFDFVWLGPLFAIIWLIIIVVAILKYRLVDVRIGFSNMGIFTGIYCLVLGVPLFLFYSGYQLTALAAAFLTASLGPLVYARVRKIAEDKILEDEKRYQDALLSAAKALRDVEGKEKIVQVVSNLLFKAMKLSQLTIFLKENHDYVVKESRGEGDFKGVKIDAPLIGLLEGQGAFIIDELEYKLLTLEDKMRAAVDELKKHAVSAVVPIAHGGELLGVIFLGDKRNKSVFSNRDVFVFNILADYAAFALLHARQR